MFYRLERQEAERLAAQFEQDNIGSSELSSTAVRVRKAFRQDLELDKDARDRILHKVKQKKYISDRRNLKYRVRSLLNPRRIVLIGSLVSAIAIIFLLLGVLGSPSDTLIIQKALAAVEQAHKISYYKISGQLNDDSGWESHWQAEYWVDYDRQMLKSIHHSLGGKREFTAVTLIKDGKVINIEKGGEGQVEVQESNAPEPFSDLITDSIKKYRESLKSGKAQLIGEEKIAGVGTYKLKTALGGTEAEDGIVNVEIANIRKDNYEPVKTTYEILQVKQGKERKLETETTVFEKFRLLDPREVDKSIFSIKVP